VDWPAFAGVMWLALGFGMLSERWQAPGLAFARWADRRYLGPQRLMDGLCLPVAMQPASHSLTRTYSRPPGRALPQAGECRGSLSPSGKGARHGR